MGKTVTLKEAVLSRNLPARLRVSTLEPERRVDQERFDSIEKRLDHIETERESLPAKVITPVVEPEEEGEVGIIRRTIRRLAD